VYNRLALTLALKKAKGSQLCKAPFLLMVFTGSRGAILSSADLAKCHCITGGKLGRDATNDRTSSTTSAFQASPMRHSLSRAHRSGSLAFQNLVTDASETVLTGSAEERENTARSALSETARQVQLATSGSQQDKARTAWVRHWYVWSS
jgi:hypothetical protein